MADQELSEQELQGQEAHTLPDREVMSLLSGASSPMPLPAFDSSGLATQAYPGADPAGGAVPAGGSHLGDLPAYGTADTNSVQSTTTATDSASS
jgi:hypothetical protein